MSTNDPEPPERSYTLPVEMPPVGRLPETLADAFAHCSAEAQMLEHALKSAISKDVSAFATVSDEVPFLEILEKITLGQAKDIAIGNSSRKQIAACVGFFDFVKTLWTQSGQPESQLGPVFKDAVARRNRIAHSLLAEVVDSTLPVADALKYLSDSKERFSELRYYIAAADTLSSHMGSIAPDGNSRPRFKTTY